MFEPKATLAQRQKAVAALVTELNRDTAPILIGPWRSEPGFEVCYWLPFLRWLATKVTEFPKRASVVTRGGLAPLYLDVACQGYDLYALRSVEEVRRENLYDARVTQKGQTIKQVQPTDWDEAVIEEAAHELGVKGLYHTVHPAWGYWALAPWWEEGAGLRYLMALTDYAPLPRLERPEGLPKQYVAVKWYGRHTFPYPHAQTEAYAQQCVLALAAQIPVVLLNAGGSYDDHIDIPVKEHANVFTLPEAKPEENLLAQAAVLSHAQAFMGTYGGIAQLALRLRVPSYSTYLQWGGTAHAHLALSSWLSKGYDVPFVVQSLQEASMTVQLLGLVPRPKPAAVPMAVA